MTDFPASYPGHAAHFTHRERREVVVQHETFSGLAFKPLDALSIVRRSQRGGDQRLGLAAGKHGRTVGTRQHADFNRDRADLIKCTSIRTFALVRDEIAQDALTQRLIVVRQFALGFVVVFRKLGFEPVFDFLDQFVALELGMLAGIKSIGELFADLRTELVVVSLIEFHGRHSALGLAAARY